MRSDRSFEKFESLLATRWREALEGYGIDPRTLSLTWEITPHYPHFDKPRGYGVTFYRGPHHCHMAYAPKILDASRARADGVVRHEIGHVIDLCLPVDFVDYVASTRGVDVPDTPERRADGIAHSIWGYPIYYDKDLLVQTTKSKGSFKVRPAHLGL